MQGAITENQLAEELLEISKACYRHEQQHAEELAASLETYTKDYEVIAQKARHYIDRFRLQKQRNTVDAFFHEYGLGTPEGLSMMCLAEALLRIPDAYTANAFIHDRLQGIEWKNHLGKSHSLLVNAATLGLRVAGKLLDAGQMLSGVVDPVLRESLKQSMRQVGNHFVMGETMKDAMIRARDYEAQGYMLSYDMLGEGARHAKQAEQYFGSYHDAISQLGKKDWGSRGLYERASISVKLSALHPRYEWAHRADVLHRLKPLIITLALHAKENGVCITIDAEEARRLDLSLYLLEEVFRDSSLWGYDGLGLAVQAYQKRSPLVLQRLVEIAKETNRRIPVRLVKGAYWDSEIKYAQVNGLPSYPVFTRKEHTDISYLACAKYMLENDDFIYPQFATHNALTLATIEQMAGEKLFEFQLLHGMGEGLYDGIVDHRRSRIYAPVGEHRDLLAYLIRRLLENGANTSFVKQLADEQTNADMLLRHPLEMARAGQFAPAQHIPAPRDIYGPKRPNSQGVDFGNAAQSAQMEEMLANYADKHWEAHTLVAGKKKKGTSVTITSPYQQDHVVGVAYEASFDDVNAAFHAASAAFDAWNGQPASVRAKILKKAATLLEKQSAEAIALCVHEAGRTVRDAVDEVREAVDFCRYYARQGKRLFGRPKQLVGATGETNELYLQGRGVFACISPWNFPLAIFTGQITAALMAGNTVIAKPAEQTPLIAAWMVNLLHKAGVPKDVLHLLIGKGEVLGSSILTHPALAGVVFTGSCETARIINTTLAAREGAIIPLIAETGGQNAGIVDSTALLEQLVDDVLISAFGSAGQRCSALRVLYVQEEIAEDFIELLVGAMQELKVGAPYDLVTDVACVIDKDARDKLQQHIQQMLTTQMLIAKAPVSGTLLADGHYVAPHVFEISSIRDLPGEVFGPVLHIIRYASDALDKVIADINSTGYGLTLGVHSRIVSRSQYIRSRVKTGNVYINRSMIGAVVGVQPFGGQGLSGTGPKAGGPHYMVRMATEQVFTVNTAAIGGNKDLLV